MKRGLAAFDDTTSVTTLVSHHVRSFETTTISVSTMTSADSSTVGDRLSTIVVSARLSGAVDRPLRQPETPAEASRGKRTNFPRTPAAST